MSSCKALTPRKVLLCVRRRAAALRRGTYQPPTYGERSEQHKAPPPSSVHREVRRQKKRAEPWWTPPGGSEVSDPDRPGRRVRPDPNLLNMCQPCDADEDGSAMLPRADPEQSNGTRVNLAPALQLRSEPVFHLALQRKEKPGRLYRPARNFTPAW